MGVTGWVFLVWNECFEIYRYYAHICACFGTEKDVRNERLGMRKERTCATCGTGMATGLVKGGVRWRKGEPAKLCTSVQLME